MSADSTPVKLTSVTGDEFQLDEWWKTSASPNPGTIMVMVTHPEYGVVVHEVSEQDYYSKVRV